MDIVLLVVLVTVVGAAAALAAVEVTRRRYESAAFEDGEASEPVAPVDEVVHEAVAAALAEMREQTTADRDAAVRAALEQAAVLQREHLGTVAQQAREQSSAELTAKKDVIDTRLDQVHAEMRSELTKLGTIVSELANNERATVRSGRPVVAQPRRDHPDALGIGACAAGGDGEPHGPRSMG